MLLSLPLTCFFFIKPWDKLLIRLKLGCPPRPGLVMASANLHARRRHPTRDYFAIRQIQRLLLKYCRLFHIILLGFYHVIWQNETHQRRSPWDDPISSVKNGPDFGFSSNLIDSVSSLPKPSVVAAKDLSTLLHSMGLTKYIGKRAHLLLIWG